MTRREQDMWDVIAVLVIVAAVAAALVMAMSF
jgi:hypothetical protein